MADLGLDFEPFKPFRGRVEVTLAHRCTSEGQMTIAARRNGRPASWGELEARVPSGHVRCGVCGFLIEISHAWQSGHQGPQHVRCEHDPPMPPQFVPRSWSHNWWGAPG